MVRIYFKEVKGEGSKLPLFKKRKQEFKMM
jgi:hypothetical protein